MEAAGEFSWSLSSLQRICAIKAIWDVLICVDRGGVGRGMRVMRAMGVSARNMLRGFVGGGGGLIMMSLPWEFLTVRNHMRETLH